MQPRQSSREQRRLDLDDAPELDSSEEAAIEAIRRQLDAEFAAVEAVREAPDPVPDQPVTRPEPEPRHRPALVRFVPPADTSPAAGKALESPPEPHARFVPPDTSAASTRRTGLEAGAEPHVRFLPPDVSAAAPPTTVEPAPAVPPRAVPDGLVRARPAGPRQPPRERQHPGPRRPESLREQRMGLAAPRPPRESLERAFAQRLPARWREAPVPLPLPDEDDEPTSRRGLLLTMGLAAGLAGGAAGALLTVVLLMGNRSDPFQDSWDMLVTAARDSGLAGVAATVTGRSDELDAERASRTASARPASPAPRRGPVTTSEITDPAQPGQGVRSTPGSTQLRDLVAAGRDAYVRNDYETAELLFAQAVQHSATDGLLRYHHAIALMGLGRFSEARAEFRNALRLGVDSTVADEAQRALAQLNTGRRRR
jgi:hypothetical protein